MKRLIILFLLMSLLGGIAYYLNQSKSGKTSSIDVTDREFAYPDISKIGKVIIQKVNSKPETFEFKDGKWYINNYLMASYKVNNIMKGITSSRVENLPPKNGLPVIYESLKKNGINIKVYDRSGKKVRDYSVGPDALNDRCTYFLMEGAMQPYCMNVSGFGSMRSRFTQKLDNWRDIALYRVNPNDIASLKVEYNKDYTSSFEIKNVDGKLTVDDIGNKTQGNKIDEGKIRQYLASFEELYGEGYDNQNIFKDSISNLVPFMTVTMLKTDGKEKSMKLYPVAEMMDPSDEISDAKDALSLEKYFVDLSTGDFMLAQQKLLKPIMRPYDYFLEE